MNRQEPLSVIFHGMSDGAPIKAGRLFWQDGCSIFEYDADYLAAGVQLSPLRLEWQAGIQQPERHPFQGLHGVFSDSLPDGWGLLVMDRTLRSMGHDPATLTPLDRLAFLGNLTLGALSYQRESYERESHERESHKRESHKRESHKRESPEPGEGSTLASDSGQPIDLHRLGREATGLYEGKEGNLDEVLERHLIHGSSPGGARPKLLVGLAPDGDSPSTIKGAAIKSAAKTSSTITSSTKTSSTIKGATIKGATIKSAAKTSSTITSSTKTSSTKTPSTKKSAAKTSSTKKKSTQSIVTGAGDLPDGYTHWLAKFPTGSSPTQQAEIRVEYIYHKMALAAGIDMTPCRLHESGRCAPCFLTQRFDRLPGNRRVHVHSLAGILHADFRVPNLDYLDLMKLTAHLTHSHKEKLQQFKRMVFNVLAGNRDDHTKNFAFMLNEQREWVITPAYDLTFSDGMMGEHSMTVNGQGRNIAESDLLAVAEAGSITVPQARAAIGEVAAGVACWDELSRDFDMPKRLRAAIVDYHRHKDFLS